MQIRPFSRSAQKIISTVDKQHQLLISTRHKVTSSLSNSTVLIEAQACPISML